MKTIKIRLETDRDVMIHCEITWEIHYEILYEILYETLYAIIVLGRYGVDQVLTATSNWQWKN